MASTQMAPALCAGALPRVGLEHAARVALSARAPTRQLLQAHAVDAPPATGLGEGIRADFPVLDQAVNGQPLVYFDNAATSQKPLPVLDAMERYYRTTNSNVHRGVHTLSAQATTMYERARDQVAAFLGAASSREVVFTRNGSEAINLVAYSWGMNNLREGDEIIISVAEHHSNIVPWQIVAKKTGARVRAVNLTKDTEELDMQHFRELLNERTKLVALFHVSNTLGAVSPVENISEMAHKVGARVLLDCCQSVPSRPVNVETLGADWIVASGHKMCGPTGCGFLWGRYEVLEQMAPFMGGGEMIQDVFLSHSTYASPPARFEAGTPAIAEAIGLGAACDYLAHLGMHNIQLYEEELGTYLYDRLKSVDKIRIYGPPPTVPRGRASLCAFNVDGLHASDVAALLDQQGVAVRSGHHCAQPLHQYFDVPASARASLYIYNTRHEVDAFIDALNDSIKFFTDLSL